MFKLTFKLQERNICSAVLDGQGNFKLKYHLKRRWDDQYYIQELVFLDQIVHQELRL